MAREETRKTVVYSYLSYQNTMHDRTMDDF
jgi:hypothetical protein